MSVEHVTAYRLSPHFRTQTSLAQCRNKMCHWHGSKVSKGSGKWKNKGIKVCVFVHLYSSYHLHPKTDRSAPFVPSIFHCTVLHQQRLQSIYVYSKSADLDNLSPFFTELDGSWQLLWHISKHVPLQGCLVYSTHNEDVAILDLSPITSTKLSIYTILQQHDCLSCIYSFPQIKTARKALVAVVISSC